MSLDKEIKILGVGHPRTGTGYTSKLLRSFGLDVGHEMLGKDGVVAWQMVKENGPWPWFKNNDEISKRPDYQTLIYNVRDPRTSIPSIVYTEKNSLEYRISQIGVPTSNNPVEHAILSILRFDELIMDMNPNVIYRIEHDSEILFNILKKDYPGIKYDSIGKKVNARGHKGFDEEILSWLERVDPSIISRINYFCIRHGYNPLVPHDL